MPRLLLIITFSLICSFSFAQKKTDTWYVLSDRGDSLATLNVDSIAWGGDYIKILKNKKWGFIDYSGRVIIKPLYEEVKKFENDLGCVKYQGKFGFVDRKGQIIIPAKFDDAFNFSCGLARVKMNEKWGYINGQGDLTINYYFTDATSFNEDYAVARKKWEKKFGLIDKTGEFVIEPLFPDLLFPKDGLCRARFDGLWGFFLPDGETAIEPSYKQAFAFSEGLAFVSDGFKFGIIDKDGAEILPYTFDNVKSIGFKDGLAAVQIDKKWGFIDQEGEIVIEPIYEDCAHFELGFAAVKKDGYWGYINKKGKVLIPIGYYSATSFGKVNNRPVTLVRGSDYVPPIIEEEPEEEIVEVKEEPKEKEEDIAPEKEVEIINIEKVVLEEAEEKEEEIEEKPIKKASSSDDELLEAMDDIHKHASNCHKALLGSLSHMGDALSADSPDELGNHVEQAETQIKKAKDNIRQLALIAQQAGRNTDALENCQLEPTFDILNAQVGSAFEGTNSSANYQKKAVTEDGFDNFEDEVLQTEQVLKNLLKTVQNIKETYEACN